MGQRQGDKRDKFGCLLTGSRTDRSPERGVIPAEAGIHPEIEPQPQGGSGWATWRRGEGSRDGPRPAPG